MLPWRQMMRAGLAAGVPVDAFWALSLREWRWLCEASLEAGLGGEGLAALMDKYPDKDET